MQNEKDFIKEYRIEDYERPSVTADIAAFTIRSEDGDSYRCDPKGRLSILLIKRGGHPFKDHWALPGGFLQPGETIEDCALREITEETGILPASIMPVGIFSTPGRDPRGWIISAAFTSVISEDSVRARGGDDADDARWFDIVFDRADDGLYLLRLTNGETVIECTLNERDSRFGKTKFGIISSGELAFDHAAIIAEALSALRNEAKNFEAIFDFLPEKFTLTALQRAQETVMNISVLPANFRRKVSDFVTETDEYTAGAGHRPAKLFTKKIQSS